MKTKSPMSRRALLRAGLGAGLLGSAGALLGCNRGGPKRATDASSNPTLRRSPAYAMADTGALAATTCTATEDNIEGPFFKAGAPHRASLVSAGTKGTRLQLDGRVLSSDCGVLAGAAIEFWHADHKGRYDNRGYRFRCRLETDDQGAYSLATIIPGRYLNGDQYRPAHIHVKLHAPGHVPLTTQLYFAGDPYNRVDPWIKDSLIMKPSDTRSGKKAVYDFVLARR